MPDRRTHRGRHPEDTEAFGEPARPRLRAAVKELSWLLTRDYADKSALKLVGDRHNLTQRQRTAVMRCACSDEALRARRARQLGPEALPGSHLLLDGYNVLTTVEAALAGGVVLVGRDGCYRDMASMHGTWREVSETLPALELVGRTLRTLGAQPCTWYLDAPVSNSGRLKTAMRTVAAEQGFAWCVELVPDPDRLLINADNPVATADSGILDGSCRWFNLARETVVRHCATPELLDFSDQVPPI